MFNQVKTKLTIVYTLSLVFLLISFIGLLYFLISDEVNQKEINELRVYFDDDKGEFIEHIFEKKHHGLHYEPKRSIFYYVYDQKGQFVHGEESIQSFYSWFEKNWLERTDTFPKRIDWKQKHILLVKEPLGAYGFAIIGMDITAEKHFIQKITWILFVLTVVFSMIFALLGYYFAGEAMKPIKTAFHKQEKFVSDASHELRTPLSIFYSSVDLLMKEEKDRLSSLGQEVLLDVKAEAHLMNKLVNDLLVLARSDKNQLILVRREVDLSELLTSIYKRFSRKMTNGILFEQKIHPGIHFVCDEARMQQLVYILLDNAFRYTRAGRVSLTLKVMKGEIMLTVEDTGCGIAAEDLPYIFDRFYRTDDSREKGGAGLGLSIAQSIVQAHGGEIFADSTNGNGSKFTVMFNEKH